ncbi:uncharacterized protein LOC144427412 [Styela clava]
MGTGASTAGAGSEVFSPRLEMTKKGPKNNILDSVPLSDVGAGTIHYRYNRPGPSVHDPPDLNEKDIRTGYFFHPKLSDYSELGDPTHEEAYKFIRVASGPKRSQNQNVYYVTGIGFQGTNDDLPPTLIKETNKRVYGHKYFKMAKEPIDGDIVTFNDEVFEASDKVVLLHMLSLCTVKDVKRKLGHHFLCPLGIVHVTIADQDVQDTEILRDIFSDESDAEISDDKELTLRLIMQPN